MKTPFDEKITEINIPESLDTRISMGFDRAKLESGMDKNRMKKRFTTIAASLALTFLALGIIGFDNVGAAIKEALKYVPGFNVLVEKQDGDLLVLPEQLEVRNGELYLKLKAAVLNDDRLHLTVEGNIGVAETLSKLQESTKDEEPMETFRELFRELNLTLKDADGNFYTGETWSLSAGGEFWNHSVDYIVPAGTTDYVLAAGGMSLDFKLAASKGVDSLEELGPYAKDKGITIVGLLKKLEDRIRVDLVGSAEAGRIYSYPMGEEFLFALFEADFSLEGLHLLDEQGNKTFSEFPSSYRNLLSEFYFNADPSKDYKLVLPYLEMEYPEVKSEKVSLKTPDDGETVPLNKSVKLGKFTVDLLDMTRKGDDVIIHLASEPLEDEVLASFAVEGVGGYGNSYEEPEGPILILSYKEIGSRFSMMLTSPDSLLKGDWVIDLAQ